VAIVKLRLLNNFTYLLTYLLWSKFALLFVAKPLLVAYWYRNSATFYSTLPCL